MDTIVSIIYYLCSSRSRFYDISYICSNHRSRYIPFRMHRWQNPQAIDTVAKVKVQKCKQTHRNKKKPQEISPNFTLLLIPQAEPTFQRPILPHPEDPDMWMSNALIRLKKCLQSHGLVKRCISCSKSNLNDKGFRILMGGLAYNYSRFPNCNI